VKRALFLGTLALVLLTCSSNASAGLPQYERVATQVWGASVPVTYQWAHSFDELEALCYWQPGTMPKYAVACAGGPLIVINWAWWKENPRFMRCQILVHEAGHTLGLKHEDQAFISGLERASELCWTRFADGWERMDDWSRPARKRRQVVRTVPFERGP
jgi:hypothetical protein